LPNATKVSLQRKLAEAQGNDEGYHVVHFIGHGSADENGSYLVFDSEKNRAELVSSDEFAEMLSEPTINLAVLNACETASATHVFQSVAQATLQRGVPAVIGMQVPVLDRTAIGFAEEFYGAWAAGQEIESALSYARRLTKEETRGAAADWGIPILYMRPVEGLKLDLVPPPLHIPPLVKFLRWTTTGFISLLGIVGLLLTIPDMNQRLRTEAPIIRCVFPIPMDPGFNIVVNQFTVVGKDVPMLFSQDGLAVADYIYRQLNYNIRDLDLGEPYHIQPPEHTCLIKGDSKSVREANAAALAKKINADIIVYGVIQAGDDLASFSPEFYVNYKSFQEAAEITGQHEFGDALSIVLPFQYTKFNPTDNPELSARIQALSSVTIGLSYYSIDNFEEASKYFLQAETTKGWPELPGKEMVYLLLGNTGNRRYSAEQSTPYALRAPYLEEALTNYNQALKLNSEFARAMVGKAGTLYLQALGDPADNRFTELDLVKLDEAMGLYNTAIKFIAAPDSADIKTKIHFGRAKIYLALYLRALETNGDSTPPLSMADSEFKAVLKEYDDGNGNVRIANLAGHSYAFLGKIARVQKKYDEAIDLTIKAITIVSPYYKSSYNISLGDIYVKKCNLDLASKAYQEAFRIAKFYGFEELITKSKKKLDEIKTCNASLDVDHKEMQP
jgi:tetratricopeptide (TPR) repeat protein